MSIYNYLRVTTLASAFFASVGTLSAQTAQDAHDATIFIDASGVATLSPSALISPSSTFRYTLASGSTTTKVSNMVTEFAPFIVNGQILGWLGDQPNSFSLSAGANNVFTKIDFASYGQPVATASGFAQGSCHAPNSKARVESAFLFKSSATIEAVYPNSLLTFFGGPAFDPCVNDAKRLAVTATYAPEVSSMTFSATQVYPVYLIAKDDNGAVTGKMVNVTVLDARCNKGNQSTKISVCHRGNSLCINPADLNDHLAHGDQLGSCEQQGNVTANNRVLDVNAHPNPSANGRFNVNVVAAVTGPVQVNLYDMQGTQLGQLFNGQMEAGESRTFSVNRSDLRQGFYTVRVQDTQKVVTSRVEVQR